ncbi:MAG: hypothetical protein AB8B57_10310 [Congregibacter sp.]
MQGAGVSYFHRLSVWIFLALLGNGGLMPDAVAQQACSATDITLTTQAEVDAFQADFGNGDICSVVEGNLAISGQGITNLDGLSAITRVNHNLNVFGNPALSNINGLGALTSVSGNLDFRDNNALTGLDGLGALTSVGGSVNLQLNSVLSNLDGLGALANVSILFIFDNDALTNLDGLGALTSMSVLFIFDNDALTNLDGLGALANVANLVVEQNDSLTNLDGLGAINRVTNLLEVQQNNALTNCAALAPVLGWPTTPHDFSDDLVGGTVRTDNVTITNNANGAQSPDDCLNTFLSNTTVALFDQRQSFLEIRDVQQASDPYIDGLSQPAEPYVSGRVAFSTGPNSSLNFANWPANFEGDNGIELALNGIEDLDIQSDAGPVFALGVDFDDESGGTTPSTFVVTGLLNDQEVFVFEFTTPPSDGRDFIGVRSNKPFDTLRIRETQAANENEFFGTVYTSTTVVSDSDGDGLFDDRDSCDATPGNEVGGIDAEGCAPSELDTDGDGVNDNLDAFPDDPDEQSDSDGDGFGDNREIDAGSDPNDPGDVPGAPGLPVWLFLEAIQ